MISVIRVRELDRNWLLAFTVVIKPKKKKKRKNQLGLGGVVHTCNPSTPEKESEDCKFKASLGYIVRPYLIHHPGKS
jgi:hypothetical protein